MIVILLGMPRSGTTLLGRSMGSGAEFTYCEEPTAIWRYKNFKKYGHDELPEEAATDDIVDYIRSRFQGILERSGRKHLVEKTPANCLRVPYVRRVFPDAKYIILWRNIEDVRRSIYRKAVLKEDANAERLSDTKVWRDRRGQVRKFLEVPLQDKASYIPLAISTVTRGRIFSSENYWGPRGKNWRSEASLDPDERIRAQCSAMTDSLRKADLYLGGRCHSVTYERLCKEPDETLEEIERFLGVPVRSFSRSFILN